jgi:hypothetical protein
MHNSDNPPATGSRGRWPSAPPGWRKAPMIERLIVHFLLFKTNSMEELGES